MEVLKPKQQFLRDNSALSSFHNAIDNPAIQKALEICLLEYVESLADTNEPVALPNYYRIQGAKAFKRMFLTLGDPPKTSDTRQSDVLNARAETYLAPPRSKP